MVNSITIVGRKLLSHTSIVDSQIFPFVIVRKERATFGLRKLAW